MALNLRFATGAELAAAFRRRYKAAEGFEAARLATWLLNRIDDGTFTDAQVRNAFGLTVAQYNALKTKFTSQRTAYLAIVAERGA